MTYIIIIHVHVQNNCSCILRTFYKNNYRKSGNFQVAKISLFLDDRGVNHIKYLISVYKALQIAKIVKISPT